MTNCQGEIMGKADEIKAIYKSAKKKAQKAEKIKQSQNDEKRLQDIKDAKKYAREILPQVLEEITKAAAEGQDKYKYDVCPHPMKETSYALYLKELLEKEGFKIEFGGYEGYDSEMGNMDRDWIEVQISD